MIAGFIGLGIGTGDIRGDAPISPLQRIDMKGFIQDGCACDSYYGCLDANILQGDDYIFSLKVITPDGQPIDYSSLIYVEWSISNAQGYVIKKSTDDGVLIDTDSIELTLEEIDTEKMNGIYTQKIVLFTDISQATVLKNSNLENPKIFVKGK